MTTAKCKQFTHTHTHTSTKKRRPWTRNLKTQLKRLLEKDVTLEGHGFHGWEKWISSMKTCTKLSNMTTIVCKQFYAHTQAWRRGGLGWEIGSPPFIFWILPKFFNILMDDHHFNNVTILKLKKVKRKTRKEKNTCFICSGQVIFKNSTFKKNKHK